MIQRVKVPVSVNFTYDHKTRRAIPRKLLWEGRIYEIRDVGHHHSYRVGHTLFHVFSVDSDTLYFRIVFNTETLGWTLEEIADGLPD
jgi:hypothetical protein